MSKRIDIVAIGLVQHDGEAYADGELIAGVPVKQAEALLQVGAARLTEDAAAEPEQDGEDGNDGKDVGKGASGRNKGAGGRAQGK